MAVGDGKHGAGFVLTGLAVGLAAGFAGFAILEHWAERADDPSAPVTTLFFLATAATGFLLLAERGASLRAIPAAFAVAALLSAPTWFMLKASADAGALGQFPVLFWAGVGAPLAFFLTTTLTKAAQTDGLPPPYSAVFFHGLTLPLILAGSAIFAGLALLLLFTWSGLLRSMDVDFFHRLFQEPWFLLPFLGGIGGLSIALIRGLDATLGGLRYLLLLACRILMPITAVLSLTLIAVLAAKGAGAVYALPYPSHVMLALAFAGMLIINGVYQNGEAAAPALWLRLSTLISLAAFPVYAGLALSAVWIRADSYGLTPPRVFGIATAGLAALYALVCVAALLSEFNWRARRWLAPIAPLNLVMALAWIVTVIGLATPLADPWVMSAKSQERLLLSGRIPVDRFDFSYLANELGPAGRKALDRLAATDPGHPQGRAIADAARQARDNHVYRLDPESGEVRFGDGHRGRRPPAGAADPELNPPDDPDDDHQTAPATP